MSAECNGCGACCDPVVLPVSQLDVARDPRLMGDEDAQFVLEVLRPIRRRDGLAKASYLSAGVTVLGAPGTPESTVLVWSMFYECPRFDPETRRCTDWENRPPLCRGYPWYDAPPDQAKALPTECSYRADLGAPTRRTR